MKSVVEKNTMAYKTILLSVAAIVITGCFLVFFLRQESEDFQLVPHKISAAGTDQRESRETQVGTGWSISSEPAEAVRQAFAMALRGKERRSPDFVIIHASSGSDVQRILDAANKILGKDAKIFGGTSDSRAVMTDKGFVKVSEEGYARMAMEGARGLAIMTVTSDRITFGVGSSELSDFSTPQEMSRAATLSAIKSAGKAPRQMPDIVLLASTIGIEEEVLEGIEEIVGTDTLVLGGTVGGPDIAVFGANAAYSEGASVAVVYTDLPIGWRFEGGFDVTDEHSGIVTKVDGQKIVEIDDKPALDVYDQWLGGKIEKLYNQVKRAEEIRDLLTLHPVYRKYRSPSGQDYFLFSHPWPADERMKGRCISTSTKIQPGERVYLSHGTWETLVNRIGNLPRHAMIQGGMSAADRPLLGIGFICGGVMGVIPETEREKLPVLINYTNNNAPFIANFTWGEQGHFPGVGNKHGNLLTSFLVIGPEKAE